MSVLAGFIVPHPPLIVPQIGRGQERAVNETAEAYREIARRIAKLEPDTIVITTPHAVMYSDYLHISPGAGAGGSFREFGAPEVSFKQFMTRIHGVIAEIDTEKRASRQGQWRRKSALDHGLVTLFFINQVCKN